MGEYLEMNPYENHHEEQLAAVRAGGYLEQYEWERADLVSQIYPDHPDWPENFKQWVIDGELWVAFGMFSTSPHSY
jgi:hypothetical protein